MGRADSRLVPRDRRYSRYPAEAVHFRLRGYHPLWPGFPASSSSRQLGNSVQVRNLCSGSHNPACATLTGLHTHGLGSSLFDRLYWGNRCLFLFLQVLRWVSSLRSLPHAMDSRTAHEAILRVVSESGTPPGQRLLASHRGFSQLSHVLRRLLVPRHPHVYPF